MSAFAIPARHRALVLASLAILGNYYVYDSIAPVAKLLHEAGLSQQQIGLLNAVFSLPNIPLALIGGVLIDRIGVARAALGSALVGTLGAGLTALGQPFVVMVSGRLLFGVGEETLFIALLAGLAQWYSGAGAAFAMSLFFSLARVGSWLVDVSPSWAAPLYARGWQPPLVLAFGISLASLGATFAYYALDQRRAAAPAMGTPERMAWRDLVHFGRGYWYILGLNVLFAAVFFPFRSTFALEYFQDVKRVSLAEAGQINSLVFFMAIFATPLFGLIADRLGHRAQILAAGALLLPLTFLILALTDWPLALSTLLMGLSFSMVPAVIWPATAMLVEPRRLGTAYGLINVIQNLVLAAVNLAAGALIDATHAGAANPAGYQPMLTGFALLGFAGFGCALALWRVESRPGNHGLNLPAHRADLPA